MLVALLAVIFKSPSNTYAPKLILKSFDPERVAVTSPVISLPRLIVRILLVSKAAVNSAVLLTVTVAAAL